MVSAPPLEPPEPVVPSLAVGGLLVTFEGIDRSGKTTQARMLTDALGERALPVREPGGTPMGERLRELLKDPAVEMSARTEALLFAAARAQLVERVVRPALESGLVVVSDRFLDSSLAYQGEARGLGVEEVARVNEWAVAGLKPDVTFLLALSPEDAAARTAGTDRFEGEGVGFQRKVQEAYERMAAKDPARWRRVAANRPPEEVHAEVLAVVEAVLQGAPA
jgi:dTMP kinase